MKIMKKIILLIIGLVLLVGSIEAQENETLGQKSEAYAVGRELRILHSVNMLPDDIVKVVVGGTDSVQVLWAKDTTDYIESFGYYDVNTFEYPTWDNGILTLGSAKKTLYLLHTTHCSLDFDDSGSVRIKKLDHARDLNALGTILLSVTITSSTKGESRLIQSVMNSFYKMDYEDVEFFSNCFHIGSLICDMYTGNTLAEAIAQEPAGSIRPKRKYRRTDLDYHISLNTNGSNLFDGLCTKHSSHQLSYNYRMLMTDHFDIHMGLGYESDIYKFGKCYVTYSDGTFFTLDTTVLDGGYFNSRFVTRYIQVPVGFGFSTKWNRKGFNVKLTAIPALGFCSRHTGLKHVAYNRYGCDHDQTNSIDALNPYKLDVRLDIKSGGIGVFFQVATLPIFLEGRKFYPVKIGLCI